MCPQANHSLVSVPKLARDGFTTIFTETKCRIPKLTLPQHQTLQQLILDSPPLLEAALNSQSLLFQTTQTKHSANIVTAMEMHCKLGHISFRHLCHHAHSAVRENPKSSYGSKWDKPNRIGDVVVHNVCGPFLDSITGARHKCAILMSNPTCTFQNFRHLYLKYYLDYRG
ncbi:hypothetical protein ROZALSC1DRAFT_24890 [Rozella allomycis CSF55]|uniref:GAG-pre-integrase domain-containing protein n=1 Tax=Rozella allomycis (strain CSF55) TaxID=988480 RepID=A0A4P9YCL3_ROZAC|nr:hypothetical protein ROZALSC1DRAFT_24890 [Rozella allomycis CSF55]